MTMITPGTPFTAARTSELIAAYNRHGCVHCGPLLSPEEVSALRDAADAVFRDPRAQTTDKLYGSYVAVRMFEWDRLFRDLLVKEPMISLMEALLGPNCHLVANNLVRNAPGQAIDTYHVDDLLWFPLPDEMPRFDPRLTIPNFLLNVQIPLTNIEADEFGPTQYVPGSHYSGRHPNHPRNPSFEGHGAISIHAKAGEFYLQHGQVWHRGAPNTSTRTRYLLQCAFGRRQVAQRFYPFLNYHLPEHLLADASPRLLRVLGKHQKGPYG